MNNYGNSPYGRKAFLFHIEKYSVLWYNVGKKGGGTVMKEKIFIFKWLNSIFVGLIAVIIGVVGFIISYIEMGIVFSLFGVVVIAWYIAFIPHSFIFDDEKITIVCTFQNKTIKYVYIKSGDKEESGIRNYPWGTYYHIISDKPYWQEIKIPSTKEIDNQIRKHIKTKK